MCQKYYTWNPSKCTCENSKYLGRIIKDLLITCDEIVNSELSDKATKPDMAKIITTNFNEKMCFVKQKVSIFYLRFYYLL